MLLSEVFLPEFVIEDLQSEDKTEVFEEMVDRFCRVTKLDVRDEVLDALQDRESKMSTGIQNGIAIPHGKTTAIERVFGVLGVSKQGIEYDSLDGKPVYLVLMLLAPPVEAERHLHLLQRMANLLRNPDFYKDITGAAGNAGRIFEILKNYEETEAIADG
ncbi:MAG: PTS sugar transporter subunit IIA [Spirochaetaceae bacterium]|jgi:PTS system fructose-specific IIC component/PTS system nitrogen regulatory IIA component|nr:PTS sugar transporter subunit IIA [Spirochaetaceae bacterium]